MTPSPKRRALNGVKRHTGLLLQCGVVAGSDGAVELAAGYPTSKPWIFSVRTIYLLFFVADADARQSLYLEPGLSQTFF